MPARRRALATDASLKADLELIAQEWLALAEEVEWLERNYGPLVSQQADGSLQSETIVQQQQQIQHKDEDKTDYDRPSTVNRSRKATFI